MKLILLLLLITTNLKAGELYVFASESLAIAAEAAISSLGNLPRVGNVNGVPAPNNTKTERWAIPKMRITDNKWYFTRVPKVIRDTYPQANTDYFNSAFPHTIEEYDVSWSPVREEI